MEPHRPPQTTHETREGGSSLQHQQEVSQYHARLYSLIREVMMAQHNQGGVRIHKRDIAKRVLDKITKLDTEGKVFIIRELWPYDEVPTKLTIYRRVEELAETADFVVSVRKGSGLYRVNPRLFKP